MSIKIKKIMLQFFLQKLLSSIFLVSLVMLVWWNINVLLLWQGNYDDCYHGNCCYGNCCYDKILWFVLVMVTTLIVSMMVLWRYWYYCYRNFARVIWEIACSCALNYSFLLKMVDNIQDNNVQYNWWYFRYLRLQAMIEMEHLMLMYQYYIM